MQIWAALQIEASYKAMARRDGCRKVPNIVQGVLEWGLFCGGRGR